MVQQISATCAGGLTLVPDGSFDGHVEQRVDHRIPQDRIVFRTDQMLTVSACQCKFTYSAQAAA